MTVGNIYSLQHLRIPTTKGFVSLILEKLWRTRKMPKMVEQVICKHPPEEGITWRLLVCACSIAPLCSIAHSCPTLCDPTDCSLPDSSVCRILQARKMEWVAISYFMGSFQPRDRTLVSCVSLLGRWILYPWCHLANSEPDRNNKLSHTEIFSCMANGTRELEEERAVALLCIWQLSPDFLLKKKKHQWKRMPDQVSSYFWLFG